MTIRTQTQIARALTTLAFAATVLAAPAFAQTPAAPASPDPAREAAFVRADVNRDGRLDKGEFTSTLPEKAQGLVDTFWGRIDADGDGFVTREQFLALRHHG